MASLKAEVGWLLHNVVVHPLIGACWFVFGVLAICGWESFPRAAIRACDWVHQWSTPVRGAP